MRSDALLEAGEVNSDLGLVGQDLEPAQPRLIPLSFFVVVHCVVIVTSLVVSRRRVKDWNPHLEQLVLGQG